MQLSKSRLIVAVTAIMFTVSGLSVAQPPILKIDGMEYSDVYLQSLDVQVEVAGSVASTRYTMTVKNKTNRVVEGGLAFSLPAGRGVSHFALDIDGKMREAVPVEQAWGTEVFNAIKRRNVDPGLLEKMDGNNFRIRIFPISAHGVRTVAIGYEEELSRENESLRYRQSIAYPGTLEKFSVKATVLNGGGKPVVSDSSVDDEFRFNKAGKNYVASFARKNYRITRELNFALPAPVPADTPLVMMRPARGSYYFLASVAPPNAETRKKQWDDNLTIIWDVSLSGSQRDIKRELEALDIIFAEKKNANVHLYYLNNTLTKMISKNTANGEHKVRNGNWDELRNILKRAVFDGGTDFSKIKLRAIAGKEILFFSDGNSTISDAYFIKNADVNATRPIHCVVSSAKADHDAMKWIADKTNGKYVNINALSSDELKDELLNETLRFLGTEHGVAVREVYPSIATSVQGEFSLSGISDAADAEVTALFGFGNKVEKRIKITLDAKKADTLVKVDMLWARKKTAELDLAYEKNRAELTEHRRRFGIVTRNTSLIVLETVYDYIRYNITPPATETGLYAEYQRRLKAQEYDYDYKLRDVMRYATEAASNIKKWWNTDFTPKSPSPDNKTEIPSGNAKSDTPTHSLTTTSERVLEGRGQTSESNAPVSSQNNAPPPVSSQSNARPAANTAGSTQTQTSTGGAKNAAQKPTAFEAAEVMGYLDCPTPVYIVDIDDPNADPITLDRGFKDNIKELGMEILGPDGPIGCRSRNKSYLDGLTGKTAEDYQRYLKLRENYAASPDFYFDFADWFYTHGDKKRALRALTSIAELGVKDAEQYRMLGYRLKEYGEYALEAFVCRMVVQWQSMDPQSYRDYALALSDNGDAQTALDSLYSLLTRASYGYGWMREVVIMEINRLIAKNANLNTSKIDKNLIVDAPVDIRVVINWNRNDSRINLHVFDPNAEVCNHRNRATKIGGRISDYYSPNPAQFLLKNAIKGKYRVYIDGQITAEPTTVIAEIYTKYAGKTEQRRIVCLQISNTTARDCGITELTTFEY